MEFVTMCVCLVYSLFSSKDEREGVSRQVSIVRFEEEGGELHVLLVREFGIFRVVVAVRDLPSALSASVLLVRGTAQGV